MLQQIFTKNAIRTPSAATIGKPLAAQTTSTNWKDCSPLVVWITRLGFPFSKMLFSEDLLNGIYHRWNWKRKVQISCFRTKKIWIWLLTGKLDIKVESLYKHNSIMTTITSKQYLYLCKYQCMFTDWILTSISLVFHED